MRPGCRPVSQASRTHSYLAPGPAAHLRAVGSEEARLLEAVGHPGKPPAPLTQVFGAGVPVIVMHEEPPRAQWPWALNLHLRRGLRAGPGPHGGPEEGQGCQRSPDARGACSCSTLAFGDACQPGSVRAPALLPSSTGPAACAAADALEVAAGRQGGRRELAGGAGALINAET